MLALLLFVLSLTTFGISCSLVMLGSAGEAATDWAQYTPIMLIYMMR